MTTPFGKRQNPIWDMERVQSRPSAEQMQAATGAGALQNKIVLWPADGSTVSLFDPNETGFDGALAAAVSGDTIWLPSIEIAIIAGKTLPAGRAQVGISPNASLAASGFSGAALTLDQSKMSHFSIVFTASGSPSVAVDATSQNAIVESPSIATIDADGVWL